MIRYRCPHCAALIVAHERRAGQSSVCKACLKPHQIPADTGLWLTETGELLNPPAPAIPVEVRSASFSEIELPLTPHEDAPAEVEVAPVEEPIYQDVAHPAEIEPVRELVASAPVVDEPSDPPQIPDLHMHGLTPVDIEHEPDGAPEEPPAPVPVVFDPEPVAPRITRPAPRLLQSEPEPVHEPEPEPTTAVAIATPPPQPARNVPSAPAPTPRAPERPAPPVPVARAVDAPPRAPRAEPVRLQTQVDIAVALTAALSSRMRPPPAPRRDLRPSTAAWMLLTGIGVACVLVTLFTDPSLWVSGLVVGILQIVIGYAWIVFLTYMRDPQRGLVCAIPPITLYYLTQYKYAKFRPLRFVLTGVVLVGLAFAAAAFATVAQSFLAKNDQKAAPDPVAESKLAQLRTFRDQRAYDSLIKLLEILAKTDPIRSADASDRTELAAELKALCGHQLTDVRVAAMAALTQWDPDPNAASARAACLAAIRSPTQEERVRALRLLPRWKDPESARAVQSLIGRAGEETNQAKMSLREIGGAPAEQAALALLKRADDQTTRLTAIGILEAVGGGESAEELRTYAMATDDPVVRTRALAAVTVIEARVRKSSP